MRDNKLETEVNDINEYYVRHPVDRKATEKLESRCGCIQLNATECHHLAAELKHMMSHRES